MCNTKYCKMLKELKICYTCLRATTTKSGYQTILGFQCRQCQALCKNICCNCFKIDNKKFYKKSQLCAWCYDKEKIKCWYALYVVL